STPLTTIGQDPYQSGILAAHLMARMTGVGGTVALVKVMPADYHISERLRGFRTAMDAIPSIRVAEYDADSHGGDSAFGVVAGKIRDENRDLVGVFVSNAWTHPFAREFNKRGSTPRVCVIGYDLVAENRKCLEAGQIDFLISQRPIMQGFEGISALYRNVVLRDKVNKSVMVPLDIITKDNVRYYLD
ncbi:MAG TPA: substrate-binding domain-containing protein, partial [Bacteroidota bacterium]|nr:substrate-binding domain-containing protein [Bacteroidota bacterium]